MIYQIDKVLSGVLILLYFNSTIVSANDRWSNVFDVVRRNWIEHEIAYWPDYESDHVDLFYMFHTENVGQKLSFKKDIVDWGSLASNGTVLSFRYWANNNLSRLCSNENTTKDLLLLDRANQWTDAKIGELTQKEWNNLTLISGGDEYTLALKEVQFSYTDANHQQVTINCSQSVGCSNIFDHSLAYGKDFYSYSKRFVPYQRINSEAKPNQPPQTYLQVNRPPALYAGTDFCIQFNYNASSGPLFVSANISTAQPLAIEFPSTTELVEYNLVCASDLTPNLDSSLRALYFWFASDKPIDQLDSNFVSLNWNNQPAVDNTLSEGVYLHSSKGGSTISFTPYAGLQFEKSKIHKSQLIRKVVFREKWIKMPLSRPNQFRITLNETNKLPDFAQLTMLISAPDRPKLFEKRLGTSSFNVFNINFESSLHLPPIEYVQIMFSFQIDFSKVKDEKKFNYKIDQFSANDPCVDEHGTENECNHHGKCFRWDYQQFEAFCDCDFGYRRNDQCKARDYCIDEVRIVDGNSTDGGHYASGLQICKNQGLYCVSNAEKLSFECDCGNRRWNPVALSCFPKEVAKCPDNQIHQLIDGKLYCACRYGMRLDSQANKCVPNSCSEENNRKCAQKGAICQVHSSGTKCACEPDKVAFLANTDRPDEWTCVDRCSVAEHFLVDLKETYLEALQCGQFSKCDPLSINFENYYDTQDKIVYKNSNISLLYGPGSREFCKCDIGFQWRDCLPSSEPTWLLSGLQFEIYPNLTKQSEKQETVEQMISNLFGGLLTNAFSKCEHKSSFLVSCDVLLNAGISAEQITAHLLDQCIPISGSSGKQCAFFTDDIKKAYFNILYLAHSFTAELILHVDSVSTPTLFSNFCDNQQICPAHFENSICRPTTTGNGTNFFDCVCDLELFDVSSTTRIFRHDRDSVSVKLKGEKCKPKNLCQTKPAQFGCKDPTAQCHSVVEYQNGTYVPISFCTCPKTSQVSHDREYICQK